MKKSFNMPPGYTITIIDNKADNSVEVMSSGGLIPAMKKAMEVAASPAYENRTLRFNFDYGDGKISVSPEERALGFTATDLWIKIWQDRTGHAPKSVLFENVRVEGGKVKADVNADGTDIYSVALDAALLSRQHGGKVVEFKFSGNKIHVDGATKPEDIEARHPSAKKPKPNLPTP